MVEEKLNTLFDSVKEKLGFTNLMQTPRVEKIVISTGTGRITEKEKIKTIQDRLAKITGQKTAPRQAKKSIASFKVREGDVVGYQVTLRGKRMNDFLNKLIHIALPRTRDFRGLSVKAIDQMGNFTIGVKEHTIFPETSDEEIKDVFGFSVTIVTTAKSREEAEALLRHIGVPFKEETAE